MYQTLIPCSGLKCEIRAAVGNVCYSIFHSCTNALQINQENQQEMFSPVQNFDLLYLQFYFHSSLHIPIDQAFAYHASLLFTISPTSLWHGISLPRTMAKLFFCGYGAFHHHLNRKGPRVTLCTHSRQVNCLLCSRAERKRSAQDWDDVYGLEITIWGLCKNCTT